MLEIILIIAIGKGFSKYAKKNNLKGGVWATIGVLSYILGQVAGVIILAITNPYDLENFGMLYAFGLPGAAIFTLTSFLIMKSVAKNKVEIADSEILDDNLLG